jgi:A/G-specific adenine glycosylase
MMLQQTQVPRVIEKYKSFIKKFPSVRALAKARLSDVLKEWNGLGYNRRAKHLHDAAVMIVEEHNGRFPHEYPSLRAIPGVGQYTANAVRVFAFDEPEVLVETNVRTAIIHHFLTKRTAIEDFDIEKIAAAAAVEQDPREWHSALFDYGSYLKRTGVRTHLQSVAYVKQSKFVGSIREVRGAILRELQQGSSLQGCPLLIAARFGRVRTEQALKGLERDGLIKKEKGSAQGGSASGRKWRIA